MTVRLRPAADRCPGLLRPYRAEDGLLVRVRIPGGQTTSSILLALARLAGTLQLTSRGNLQLRGIAEDKLAAVTERIAELGLLPSASHELVRNIVASPMTGLTADRPDLRPLIVELDEAICAQPELAQLPGRFLFAIDDGRGDVWSLTFDIGYRAVDDRRGVVALGGGSVDPRRRPARMMNRAEAAAAMVRGALDFVQARNSQPSAWRIWELGATTDPEGSLDLDYHGRSLPLPGALAGAACVGVPLGFLTAAQASAVHEVTAGRTVVITPWRSLIIPGAGDKLGALKAAGLTTHRDSPWTMITACVGAPNCGNASINTRQVAVELASGPTPKRPIHVSGCERRCGAPTGDHDELVGRA